MPSIDQTVREVVRRLARREARGIVAPLRRKVGKQRRAIAQLKRQLASVARDQQILRRGVAGQASVAAAAPAAGRAWITRQGIRSLRRRLGLTQALFAKLIGASALTVSAWECGQGKLSLRQRTSAAILAARKLGAREARARLALAGKRTK